MFKDLDIEVGDVVTDITDEPKDVEASKKRCRRIPKDQRGHPILSSSQKNMVASLNTLPNLRKKLAFIHPEINTHGVIICRDGTWIDSHKAGRGVLQHWRDNFHL